MNILRYASPGRWRNFVASRRELLRRQRADDALDACWADFGPVATSRDAELIVADGLWNNPGYFLRLRLFIEAVAKDHPVRLLGILRRRGDWRERRALERIGFREFVYLREDEEFPVAGYLSEARRLLKNAASHADLMRTVLPEGVPTYVWYDSVLHKLRNGQPAVDHPEWAESLAEVLAYIDVYRRVFATHTIRCFAFSHAWKNEWGTALAMALSRNVEFFCVSQVSEALRIRRCRSHDDFIRPVEHLPFREFDQLAPDVQRELSQLGYKQLERRFSAQTTDINTRYAFSPEHRTTDREAARARLGGDGGRPIGIIYGHSWFDYPHIYGMRNFTDFVDWFRTTVEFVRSLDHVTWLLKPHPMEVWYGGSKMSDLIGDLPPHVRLLPHKTDSVTAMSAADAIVSVHGTVGLEAAASGVPVICADRAFYDDWGFAHVAASSGEYRDLLGRIGRFERPDRLLRDRAAACFACAYGEPHGVVEALRVPCDSLGAALYDWVRDAVVSDPRKFAVEVDRLAAFCRQDEFDSYSARSFVDAARRQAAAASGAGLVGFTQ